MADDPVPDSTPLGVVGSPKPPTPVIRRMLQASRDGYAKTANNGKRPDDSNAIDGVERPDKA